MKVKDHIYVAENAFPEGTCEKYINYLEECKRLGVFWERHKTEDIPPLWKRDMSVSAIGHKAFGKVESLKCSTKDEYFIHHFFNEHYSRYSGFYEVLKGLPPHRIYDFKVQKTNVGDGGGYHVWHCEQGTKDNRDRICAFMLYLNTVEEGGETEFLYQSVRFKPVKNTLLIWPAGYTHTHRGNPPLSNEKYIVTGWVEWA